MMHDPHGICGCPACSPPDTAKASAVEKMVASEICSARGGNPYKVSRGGVEEWENWLVAARGAIRLATQPIPVPTGEAEGRDVERVARAIFRCNFHPSDRQEIIDEIFDRNHEDRSRAFKQAEAAIASLSPAPRQTEEGLVEKIADFLKSRDEAFIMSDEQTDAERLESAREILALSALPAQGEPVAWIPAADLKILETEPCATARVFNRVDSGYFWKPLYATPPQPDAERIEAEKKLIDAFNRDADGTYVLKHFRAAEVYERAHDFVLALRKGEQK